MPEPEEISHYLYAFTIFADYYQIYFCDEQSEEIPEDWEDELITNMIAVGPGIVGISTIRNMSVPVYINVLKAPPEDTFAFWDQVTEASLNIISGKIVVMGPTDYFPDAKRFSVESGNYRIRVCYKGLESISTDGLKGNDYYYITLWPQEYSLPKVLKK